MATQIRVQTRVQPGGRVEVTDPELHAGDTVDVIIQTHVPAEHSHRRSALDIINEAPGHVLFKTAEEVDAYIRELRDEWDR